MENEGKERGNRERENVERKGMRGKGKGIQERGDDEGMRGGWIKEGEERPQRF